MDEKLQECKKGNTWLWACENYMRVLRRLDYFRRTFVLAKLDTMDAWWETLPRKELMKNITYKADTMRKMSTKSVFALFKTVLHKAIKEAKAEQRTGRADTVYGRKLHMKRVHTIITKAYDALDDRFSLMLELLQDTHKHELLK